MANQGRKFSIFRGNHEKIDIRIGIPFSIRPTTTKFDNQVHL